MSRSFTAVAAADVKLVDAPIRVEWVRSGAPRARMGEVARSADGTAVCVVWDCTAGEFEWRFGVDETVHILAGEVVVRDGDGAERRLIAGDIGFFPYGSVSTWRVEEYVRKLAFCRHVIPAPLGVVVRALNKLKSLCGLGVDGAAMGANVSPTL